MDGTQAGQGVDFRKSTKIVLASRMNDAGQRCVCHEPRGGVGICTAELRRALGKVALGVAGQYGNMPDSGAEMKKGPEGPFSRISRASLGIKIWSGKRVMH